TDGVKDDRRHEEQPLVDTGDQFVFNANQTLKDLRKFAQEHENRRADLEIVLAKDLTLEDDTEAALALTGHRITLRSDRPDDPTPRRTIWLRYTTRGNVEKIYSALTLRAEEVILRGLRVVVTGNAATVGMTGVHLIGGQKHLVTDCHFLQQYP